MSWLPTFGDAFAIAAFFICVLCIIVSSKT